MSVALYRGVVRVFFVRFVLPRGDIADEGVNEVGSHPANAWVDQVSCPARALGVDRRGVTA